MVLMGHGSSFPDDLSMLERIRQFLTTGAGKIASIVIVVLMLGLVVYSYKSTFSNDFRIPDHFTYIDSESNRTFEFDRSEGMKSPVKSPFTGKMTGYPASPCYWTKDGKIRKEPFWVLANRTKGVQEPTYCPDCDRLVDEQANEPYPGTEPPPKRPRGDRAAN